MSLAKDIRDDLFSWLPFWGTLQEKKNEYDLTELNTIYYNYNKSFLKHREEIKEIVLKDKFLYSEVKELMSNDLLFDVLIDGWSNDINRQGDNDDSVLALLPFPHQIVLIDRLQNSKKHLHIQKSRRQGASVFTSYYMSWLVKHEKNKIIFATHKDLKSLDGGLTDIARNSTYGRIRWYLDKSIIVPDEWKDKAKYWNKLTKDYQTSEKEITFKGSTITGSVLGKGTAVGFAGHIICVDELDVVCDLFPNQADAIFGSFSTAVNRMIIFSTYRGMIYPFYQIYETYDETKWDFITLNWKDSPVCNEAWYEEQCAKMNYDSVLIARELDIDPSQTRQGVIWSTIDKDNLIKMDNMDFDTPEYTKIIGADGGGGSSATAFILGYMHKGSGQIFLKYLIKTTDMDEYEIRDEFIKYGFMNVPVYADQSMLSQVGTAGHDWYNVLRNVKIRVIPVYNKEPHKARAMVRHMFRANEIFINSSNLTLKRDLMSASYKPESEDLKKDTHSHTADALMYLIRHLFSKGDGITTINY